MNQTIMGGAVARSCLILLHSVCRKTRGCVRRGFSRVRDNKSF